MEGKRSAARHPKATPGGTTGTATVHTEHDVAKAMAVLGADRYADTVLVFHDARTLCVTPGSLGRLTPK